QASGICRRRREHSTHFWSGRMKQARLTRRASCIPILSAGPCLAPCPTQYVVAERLLDVWGNQMTNPVTQDRRHFEDLAVGEVIDLGRTTVSKEMITTFAREFDPFPFHLDEEAAKASLLGGLASSGWQTGALSLRMLVDNF